MKDWYYSVNSHPDWRLGNLHVVNYPFWLWIMEWLVERLVLPYTILNRIPLPNIGKITDDWSEETYTWREWYGTVGDLWWACVYDPCFQWIWRHKFKHETTIELGYDRLKEIFEHKDPQFFKSEED